jgi:hypothetical protein
VLTRLGAHYPTLVVTSGAGDNLERSLEARCSRRKRRRARYGGRPPLSEPAYFTVQTPSLGSVGLAPSTGPM